MGSGLNFESVVATYYEPLYQFAFGLTRVEADACDLTQQTFYVWATKGHQLRDETKVKTWLFTTLHRAFLESRRRQTRFPHFELDEIPLELRGLHPDNPVNRVRDGGTQLELSVRVRGLSPRSPLPGADGLSPVTSALVQGLAAAARSW